MKSIKFFISTLVVLILVMIMGVQNSFAQYPNIHVTWGPPPDCECSMVGNFYYRIDVAIINECGEEFFTEWEGYQFAPGTASDVNFYPDWSCEGTSNDPCYLVTGVIRKYCPDGHGGYIEQCSGKPNVLVSCYTLMHNPIQAVIAWE